MSQSALPSTHRKLVSEDMDHEQAWDAGESRDETAAAGVSRRISPTALAYSSQCLLRGLWAVEGVVGIGPSPFTRATFADGKAFEAVLLEAEPKKIWIRALNLAMGTNFPDDLRIIKGTELNIRKAEAPAAFLGRAKAALAKNLPADMGTPFSITEPTLASEESEAVLRGKPDLLLWTGQNWIIADIKCSEEARRTHGIQIAAYARMLSAMRPGEPIDPRGVVIHCAAGYRFTADSSPDDRKTALSHTQATPFPIASLESVIADAIRFLADADGKSGEKAIANAVFSSVCNECNFRHRCYPRFLEARHVSLLPLMRAELEAVIEAGITSTDQLTAAIDSGEGGPYDTLLELKESSPLQLRFLREKAEKVLACGIYSAWRASPASTAMLGCLFRRRAPPRMGENAGVQKNVAGDPGLRPQQGNPANPPWPDPESDPPPAGALAGLGPRRTPSLRIPRLALGELFRRPEGIRAIPRGIPGH